ncbi:helix-turn-helix domain-containing protein [Nocardia sp. NPDC050406]|uniref:helix-turn-helix domain-containing protein n=1 Tax=Nocardia sp. NPDC050406 TaxID=3364318 RepID=UPI0037B8F422
MTTPPDAAGSIDESCGIVQIRQTKDLTSHFGHAITNLRHHDTREYGARHENYGPQNPRLPRHLTHPFGVHIGSGSVSRHQITRRKRHYLGRPRNMLEAQNEPVQTEPTQIARLTKMSTVSRRALGKFFREMREGAGKSALAAGLHIETSKQTLLRMEDGIPTKIATSQLAQLLSFYDAPEDKRKEALALWAEIREQAKAARSQGNSKGFWVGYADQIASHFPHYLRLESTADHVVTHQLVLVPGLLQTPDYRRSIVRIDGPGLSLVDIERRVELTARRQARLDSDQFHLDAFISEAALRHPIGGSAIMADQLRALAETTERDNVRVRVVPFGPAHRGLTIGSFTLLEFPQLASGLVDPPVVYLEGAIGALYHEREDVIAQYRAAITSLEAVALSRADTRDMVLRVAKEHAA